MKGKVEGIWKWDREKYEDRNKGQGRGRGFGTGKWAREIVQEMKVRHGKGTGSRDKEMGPGQGIPEKDMEMGQEMKGRHEKEQRQGNRKWDRVKEEVKGT